jgi:hypothetical protein
MTIHDIINNTKCPFARRTKYSTIVINSLDLFTEIRNIRQEISHFFTIDAKMKLDALVFIFTNHCFGNTIDSLTMNTKMFFQALSKEFSGVVVPNEIIDYNAIYWPSIEGERFFMVSFASCYSKESPRFNHGDLNTYFFLQPVSSFERHAKDNDAVSHEMRIHIRKLFARNQQPYDGEISDLRNELVKMVSPLRLGDPIIKWWEY